MLTACGTVQDYTAFKASRPLSILVLPPLNGLPDSSSNDSILSKATYPLAEAGYYVIPITLMYEIFEQNGVTNALDIHNIPPQKLHEIFGADAAFYIELIDHGPSPLFGSHDVAFTVRTKLMDLRTGKTLLDNKPAIQTISSISDFFEMQAFNIPFKSSSYSAAHLQVINKLYANQPNGVLYGPYSPKYGTD